LEQAVDRKDFAEARRLLSGNSGWTKVELSDALATAAGHGGDIDLLRELLRHGADPNWKGALVLAALSGRPDVVTLLINAGANVHVRDESLGLTALHAAVGRPSPTEPPDPPNANRGAVIEILVKAGIPVDVRDQWQRTALNWNLRGREAVVSTLIRLGADVNTQNSDGETPLMSNDNAKATELLLAAGANPFIKDLHGWTVRDNDDRRILFQRQAIVATVNRWISNNPAAAERAKAEA
jgi:ankyrin repeat protein